MLSEFALDPDAIEDIKDLRFLREAFGLPKGRLLAELPMGWASRVGRRLGHKGTLDDHRITEMLRLIQESMTRRNAPPDAAFLAIVKAEHFRRPFRAILTAGAVPEGIPAVPFQEAAESPLWNESRSVSWARCPGTIRGRLSMFAATSRELQLIDPYFNLQKPGCRTFLQELLELIRAMRGPTACHVRLQIHVGPDAEGTSIARDTWTRQLERIAPWVPLAVRVCHWSEPSFGSRFHNRYLLNDRGGVQFGDGLELRASGGGLDTANLLGEAAYLDLRSRLAQGRPDQEAQWAITRNRNYRARMA